MVSEKSTSPTPEDMHWGISYLREDLQDVKHDMRDFRKEVAAEFGNVRKEMAAGLANVRSEMALQFADMRREVGQQARNNLMIMVGVTGIFASIIIAFIIAFIEYRLPGG